MATSIENSDAAWNPAEKGDLGTGSASTVAEEWKPRRGEMLIFACLALLSYIISLDTTIITPTIPFLERALHGTTVEAFWAGTSYLLASAVCQPLIVDLSDAFGRRQILSVAVVLFTVGTILCAVSHGFPQLLVGRSVQGIGGGAIMAQCLVITTDIVPLRQRPTYYAIVQMAWALGSLTGPVVGGAIAEHTTWRWIFYINLPFCGIGVVTVPLIVRLHAKRPSVMERLASIDWLGAALFIASLCSFLIGVTWGGVQFPWSSWRTILPMVLGAIGLVGSMFWEAYAAKRRFFEITLFRNPSAAIAYLCSCMHGALMLGFYYFIPLFFQTVKRYNAVESGLVVMVPLALLMPTAGVSGVLFTRLGRYRWAIWLGWLMVTVSLGVMALLDEHSSAGAWVPMLLVLGIGHGLLLTGLNFTVQALAKDKQEASAAGMYIFMRSLGMCLGVAAAGTFFQNRLTSQLARRHLPVSVAKQAAEFPLRLRSGDLDPLLKARFISAFTQSFRELWLFFMAVSALGLLLSCFVRHAPLDRELQTDHVLRDRPSRG